MFILATSTSPVQRHRIWPPRRRRYQKMICSSIAEKHGRQMWLEDEVRLAALVWCKLIWWFRLRETSERHRLNDAFRGRCCSSGRIGASISTTVAPTSTHGALACSGQSSIRCSIKVSIHLPGRSREHSVDPCRVSSLVFRNGVTSPVAWIASDPNLKLGLSTYVGPAKSDRL
jgi:hypothetical protein